MPTMSIIHTEEAAPGPVLMLSRLRLEDVEDDADPIFVVVPDDALVGVGCIGAYDAVLTH